jgi:RNA polymerase-binding protein DksA
MKKKTVKPKAKQREPVKTIKKLIQTAKAKKVKTPFSTGKLHGFTSLLIRLKEALKNTVNQMEGEALSQSRRDAAGDLSNLPIHIADMGTDTYEQDFTLGLIENEGEEIHEIDAALERIEDKTYGICERCSHGISEKRLMAIPYARLCVKCKEQEETES